MRVALLVLTILLAVARCGWAQSPSVSAAVDTSTVVWQPGYLDIHHINTGRGNAAFAVFPDGTTLLIDAGDIDDASAKKNFPLTVTRPYPDASRSAGQWIVEYIGQVLPRQSKPVIDYALITHFHSDHMGVVTAKTRTAANGAYKLSGLSDVGDQLPIRKLLDRGYPNYYYPIKLSEVYGAEPGVFPNYLRFIQYQKETNNLVVESLRAGASNQITLVYEPGRYPACTIRGVKANATIWTGQGDATIDYFNTDSLLAKGRKFSENTLSLALKLSYGPFDYYTGGDNTGLQGFSMPHWFDVETPMAKAVGKVEVMTLNHHGNRDATNENFLRGLQPQVVVEQTWCSDHPGQEVMHRLLSDYLYDGPKNVFATNIQEATKTTLGFWFTNGYKSMSGHVIIRVLPGGGSYYVLIAETINQQIRIKKVFGPFQSV